jgi:hypothetical protein
MMKPWMLLLAAVCCCLPVSCSTLDHSGSSDQLLSQSPPENGEAASEWWKATIDAAPLELLAIYAEAAERHRARHSSATYEIWVPIKVCHPSYINAAVGPETMVSYHLPCPATDGADALIRQRISGFYPSAQADCPWRMLWAKHCNSCSGEQAMAIWRDAKAKVLDQEPPPAIRH